MKYINTITRNIIETECAVEGENWLPLGETVPEKKVEKKVEAPKAEEVKEKTEEVKEEPKTEEAPKKTVAKKTTNTVKPRKTR